MSMLLITLGRLRGDAALGRYAAGVIPLIAAAGAEVISRGSPEETAVGDRDHRPDLVAVMRFPSANAIRNFLASPEYRAHIVHRNSSSPHLKGKNGGPFTYFSAEEVGSHCELITFEGSKRFTGLQTRRQLDEGDRGPRIGKLSIRYNEYS